MAIPIPVNFVPMDTGVEAMDEDEEICEIPCCLCETMIKPNDANMCAKCLNDQVDISEGCCKEMTIFRCRGCMAWFRNPQWIIAELESAELLTMCLKKIKGLNKVKLIDAAFVWTEPHSKRLIIKLTIQGAAIGKAILQKKFQVDIVIANKQCDNCAKQYTIHVWDACVQVRQKVKHKRTFLFLEQLILKHGMASSAMGIAEQPDGLDFFFDHRSKAAHFIDFLRDVVPIRSKSSKRLISQDYHNNTTRYKYTHYAEIAGPCKDSLICLPKSLCRKKGGICPLLLVRKVTSTMHLMDPTSMTCIELNSAQYFGDGSAFKSIAHRKQTRPYYVMDVRQLGNIQHKHHHAEVDLVPEERIGDESAVISVNTHLGKILQPGDIVACYDILGMQLDEYDGLSWYYGKQKHDLPEVIPIRKIYSRRKKRKWKLKELTREPMKAGMNGHNKRGQEMEEIEREQFLREIEEDPTGDMRERINIFRDPDVMTESESNAEDGDVAPRVPRNEMQAYGAPVQPPTPKGFLQTNPVGRGRG